MVPVLMAKITHLGDNSWEILGNSLLVSVLGMGVVFLVLIALNFVIRGLAVFVRTLEKPAAAAPAVVTPAVSAGPVSAPAAPPPGMVPAAGSQGDVDLHDVDDKTAAMIMAIVADEMQTPLNQLRFRSIREHKPEKR